MNKCTRNSHIQARYSTAAVAFLFCSFSFSIRYMSNVMRVLVEGMSEHVHTSRRSSLRLAIPAAFSSFDMGFTVRSFSESAN